MLSSSLEGIDFFQKLIAENGNESLPRISSYLQYEFCLQSNYLFCQGDQGTRFYIILQGVVGVMIPIVRPFPNTFNNIAHINGKNSTFSPLLKPSVETRKTAKLYFKSETFQIEDKNKDLLEVKELKTGESFGELALISSKVRSSSIFCKEDCHFAYLEKEGFEKVLKELEEKRLYEGLTTLRRFSIFSTMRQKNLMNFFYGFQNQKLSKGSFVYRENEVAESLFLIKEGEFLITKEIRRKAHNNQNILLKSSIKLAILQKGDVMGDEDIDVENKAKLREFSAMCFSNQAEILEMKMEDFLKYIKRESGSLFESLMSESQNKTNRFHRRMLENCHLVKSQEDSKDKDKLGQSKKKLKELFSSNNFHMIKGELNGFHRNQEKLKNFEKLKTLRRIKILNEVEEVIDNCEESRKHLYKSALLGKFKMRMENIEKSSAFCLNKGRSLSTELTNNPLILKNIGFFSPKYSRIMDIITQEKDRDANKNLISVRVKK